MWKSTQTHRHNTHTHVDTTHTETQAHQTHRHVHTETHRHNTHTHTKDTHVRGVFRPQPEGTRSNFLPWNQCVCENLVSQPRVGIPQSSVLPIPSLVVTPNQYQGQTLTSRSLQTPAPFPPRPTMQVTPLNWIDPSLGSLPAAGPALSSNFFLSWSLPCAANI